MFEFDQFEARLWAGDTTGDATGDATVDATGLVTGDAANSAPPAALAFLWWSEHCIECAEPECYTSCALYQRRPDGRCRRFAWGIRPAPAAASYRGVAADVAFKTWGKLETHGNAWLEPAATVLRRERLLAGGARAWSAPAAEDAALTRDPEGRPLPPAPRRIVKRLHARWLRGEAAPAFRPEHFRVDVHNPGAAAVALQVSMRIADATPDGPPPFLTSLTLPPGRSCHTIAAPLFAPILDARRPFKIAVMPAGDATARLIFLGLDLVGAPAPVRPPAAPPIKCVVFDLDGTVWDGVLVEGGDTRPRAAMLALIQALDARGILVSVASKNDPAAALAGLRAGGLADYVLHPQIGWGPKSRGLRAIAESLNIGIDSLAFVDDSPFERAEVAAALPEVRCVAAEDAPTLLDDPRCAGSAGADARQRRAYYRTEASRRDAAAAWAEDHLGFLKSCALVLHIDDYQDADFERVVDLVQRTNQLNFSGAKYTRDQVATALDDDGLRVLVLRCQDRFGDYGTVGVVLVQRTGRVLRIEDMMISCRVQGRRIEQAVFAHLAATAAAKTPDGTPDKALDALWIRFRPTGRNAPAARLLDELGFTADGDGQMLRLAGRPLACDVVRIAGAEASQSGGGSCGGGADGVRDNHDTPDAGVGMPPYRG